MKQIFPSFQRYLKARYRELITQFGLMTLLFIVNSITIAFNEMPVDEIFTIFPYSYLSFAQTTVVLFQWEALKNFPVLFIGYLLSLGISAELTRIILFSFGYHQKLWTVTVYAISLLAGLLLLPLWGRFTFCFLFDC